MYWHSAFTMADDHGQWPMPIIETIITDFIQDSVILKCIFYAYIFFRSSNEAAEMLHSRINGESIAIAKKSVRADCHRSIRNTYAIPRCMLVYMYK